MSLLQPLYYETVVIDINNLMSKWVENYLVELFVHVCLNK